MVAQSAAPGGSSILRADADPRIDLQFVRASGLAQARLQVAVLSGNRRRALEQIDRLVAIDKQLELLAEGDAHGLPDSQRLDGDLADQRLALASEKLALTSEITLPRLEPAFGAGMGQVLELHEEVEIVEDEAVRSWLVRTLVWAASLLVLGAAAAAAAFVLL